MNQSSGHLQGVIHFVMVDNGWIYASDNLYSPILLAHNFKVHPGGIAGNKSP